MSQLPVVESCESCGLCCQTMGVPYLYGPSQRDLDPHWKTVPDRVKSELDQFIREGGAELGEPCFWYDTVNKNCKQHHCRPQICRDFELGSQRCINLRAHHAKTLRREM